LGKSRLMVRFTLPAALVAACCAATPAAEASVVPVDVQSTVAATVDQVPATASVVTTVTNTVRPAVERVRTEVTTPTDAAAPAADPAVASATDLAGPTVERAGHTTAAAVTVATGGARELHAGASAAPDRDARFTRPGRGHTGKSAARGGGRAALAHVPRSTPRPAGDPANRGVDAAPRTAAHHPPAAPDPEPRTGGGNAASAPAAGFALGGVALLTLAVCLAGPRLRRRLLIRPAVPRPVAFVALLERPG
jgi:hypothetical protein